MKAQVLLIDPQKDFTSPNGALYVPGGDGDMERLAKFLTQVSKDISQLYVTLDQHHSVDIAHPYWYVDRAGKPAKPFTIMSYDESADEIMGVSVADGSLATYDVRDSSKREHTKRYLESVQEARGSAHVVWPEHCVIGTEGATLHSSVAQAVAHWERDSGSPASFVRKGEDPYTEHFSAIRAEVTTSNPATWTNRNLLESLVPADLLFVGGEALSHCVAETVRDIVSNLGDGYAERIVLLSDCCSNVQTFDSRGDEFIRDMRALGMRVMTSAEAAEIL